MVLFSCRVCNCNCPCFLFLFRSFLGWISLLTYCSPSAETLPCSAHEASAGAVSDWRVERPRCNGRVPAGVDGKSDCWGWNKIFFTWSAFFDLVFLFFVWFVGSKIFSGFFSFHLARLAALLCAVRRGYHRSISYLPNQKDTLEEVYRCRL